MTFDRHSLRIAAAAAFAVVLLVASSSEARRRQRHVPKVGPNVARQSSLKLLRGRVVEELGAARIKAHIKHVGHRQAGVAFATGQGKPTKLNLDRLLPQATPQVRQKARAVLEQVGQRSAAVWVKAIGDASKGQRDPAVKSALKACAAEIERVGAAGRPKGWEKAERERFEKRFTRALLRRHGGHTDAALAKIALPSLPSSKNPQVAAELKKAPKGTTANKLAHLERRAATLLGSIKAKDQRRGHALRQYLAAYKGGDWVDKALSKQLNRFAKEKGLAWHLTDNVAYQNGVSADQKREMKGRLTKAWKIARGVVHPDLLSWLPAVRVEIDARATGAYHEGDLIKLRPDSSVGDILHELGHHIEDYGGLRTIAGAHAILNRRAFGGAMKPLTAIDPNGSYHPSSKGFAGAFIRPYMGKRYQDGSTEILSTALEKLASPKSAKSLFSQDGDHYLQLLRAVQRKPWPMVD